MDAKEKEKILQAFQKNWIKDVGPGGIDQGPEWIKVNDKGKAKAPEAKEQPLKTVTSTVGTSSVPTKQKVVEKSTAGTIQVPTAQKDRIKTPETSPTFLQAAKKPKSGFYQQQGAAQVIKPWYNKGLLRDLPGIYEIFNSLFVIGQKQNVKPMGYLLTTLEKEIQKLTEENATLQKKLVAQENNFQRARSVAENMIKYCTAETSITQKKRLQGVIKEKTTNDRLLQSMFSKLEISDLIKIRISDFGDFLETFKFTGSLVEKIKIEKRFAEMVELFERDLIPSEMVIKLLKEQEKDGLEEIFKKESQLVLNQHNRPRMIIAYDEVFYHQDAIRKGLVCEIWVDIRQLKKINKYIPDICFRSLEKIFSKFQTNYRFQIFGIWEEKKYIKVFPSYQIWILNKSSDMPEYTFITQKDANIDFEKERYFAAKEFFLYLWREYDNFGSVEIEGYVILFDSTAKKEKREKKEFLFSLLNRGNLGEIASAARDDFLVEQNIDWDNWTTSAAADDAAAEDADGYEDDAEDIMEETSAAKG